MIFTRVPGVEKDGTRVVSSTSLKITKPYLSDDRVLSGIFSPVVVSPLVFVLTFLGTLVVLSILTVVCPTRARLNAD